MDNRNQQLKWWESQVDEIFMGAFICAVAVVAVLNMQEEGLAVATAEISGIGVYLGGKGKAK